MRQGKAEVPAPARSGAVQGSEFPSSEIPDLHLQQVGFVTAWEHWMLHDISNSFPHPAIWGLISPIISSFLFKVKIALKWSRSAGKNTVHKLSNDSSTRNGSWQWLKTAPKKPLMWKTCHDFVIIQWLDLCAAHKHEPGLGQQMRHQILKARHALEQMTHGFLAWRESRKLSAKADKAFSESSRSGTKKEESGFLFYQCSAASGSVAAEREENYPARNHSFSSHPIW